jgi:hypothetical protein
LSDPIHGFGFPLGDARLGYANPSKLLFGEEDRISLFPLLGQLHRDIIGSIVDCVPIDTHGHCLDD